MSAPPPPPLKRLGQHFLVDPNIVRKIVATAGVQPGDTVLEIGPGRGILTRALCAAARTVVAVELDAKLVDYAREHLADCPNLDLQQGDALDWPLEQLPPGTLVVANLPYYVSTPLLFRLLEARDRFDRLVLMLQTEVARRLVAQPGSKDYGVLSVMTQAHAAPSLAFQVSPSCFRPRPDVGSAVVTLPLRRPSLIEQAGEARFAQTVRAAFAHRRKTLANALRDEGLAQDDIGRALAAAGIDPLRRAETLSVQEFIFLSRALARQPG